MTDLKMHDVGMYYRPGTSDEVVIREIFRENVYRLPPTLPAHCTIVDLGANIGAFTRRCANTCEHLVAYVVEADPTNMELATRNLDTERGRHVFHLRRQAAWRHSGEVVRFQSSETSAEPGGCHLDTTGDIQVRTVGLNDILEEIPHVDVLKVDIEGGEYEVFRGVVPEQLAKVGYITMEYHPTTPWPWGVMLAKILETHEILSCFGSIERGGQLYAQRYTS